MEIRKMAELHALYPDPQEGIRYDSPEILLMKHVSEKDPERALELFRDRRQFSDVPPAVDTPYGRFEGKEQIRAFAEDFIGRFEADALSIVPKFQTRGGGRSVTEMVLNFEKDGMIDQVPMFVVADLGSRGTLEEVRLYCHSSFVPETDVWSRPSGNGGSGADDRRRPGILYRAAPYAQRGRGKDSPLHASGLRVRRVRPVPRAGT